MLHLVILNVICWLADLLGSVAQRVDAEIMHGEQPGTSVRCILEYSPATSFALLHVCCPSVLAKVC